MVLSARQNLLSLNVRKRVFWRMRRAKIQFSLRMRAVG